MILTLAAKLVVGGVHGCGRKREPRPGEREPTAWQRDRREYIASTAAGGSASPLTSSDGASAGSTSSRSESEIETNSVLSWWRPSGRTPVTARRVLIFARAGSARIIAALRRG